jgi:hypothetical protein
MSAWDYERTLLALSVWEQAQAAMPARKTGTPSYNPTPPETPGAGPQFAPDTGPTKITFEDW